MARPDGRPRSSEVGSNEAIHAAFRLSSNLRRVVCRTWDAGWKIKTDAIELQRWLEQHDYLMIEARLNVLAVHASDKALADIAPQAVRQPAPA
jgi:hypothetical protein